MKDLRGRLEKLEQAAKPQGEVVVIKQIGRETTDETTRCQKRHPPLDRAGRVGRDTQRRQRLTCFPLSGPRPVRIFS